MKKTNPTSDMIRKIQADLQKSLDELGTKYGYKLKFGNGTYSPDGNFTLKLVGNKDGVKSIAAQIYDRKHISMRLPPLGTEITFGIGSRKYTIVGMSKTGVKIHGVCNGLTYLLPVVDVQMVWENMRMKAEKAELMA
jgi:hypothetical protein